MAARSFLATKQVETSAQAPIGAGHCILQRPQNVILTASDLLMEVVLVSHVLADRTKQMPLSKHDNVIEQLAT
jgi:hypothetical protein